MHGKCRAVEAQILDLLHLERRDGLHAVGNDFSIRLTGHGANARIVAVQVGDLRIVKTFHELGFGFGNLINRLKKLEVHRVHVRDHAFVRFGDRCEFADLAFGGHPHLEHADRLVLFRATQAEQQRLT